MHYLYHFGNRVFLFNQYDCSVHKFWRKHKVTIVFLKMGPKCSLASPGGTPCNGLYQSSAQTCTFFRLQIYEKVGISLVDVSRVCKFYWWVESLWLLLRKFWSHFGIFRVKYHNKKSHFPTFQHVVLACIHYHEEYTKQLWRSADLESSNPWWQSSTNLWSY